MYGYTPSIVKDKDFESIEQHWLTMCGQRNIPPALVRFMYWDKKQGKQNSRYWSHVLEPENKKLDFDNLEKKHMDITRAKTEFVEKASLIVVPAFAKKAAEDLPTSVGKLIEWFATADYNKLQPLKLITNWEIASTVDGCQDSSKGLTLKCKYIEFEDDGIVYPMAIRPAGSPFVLLNRNVNRNINRNIGENKVGKLVWDTLMRHENKYLMVDFRPLNAKAISFNADATSNGIMQFEIDGAKWLYIPNVNYDESTKPIMTFGIMVKTDTMPKDEVRRRAACAGCYGPYYLKTGIDPMIANASSEVEKAYAKQVCNLIDVLYTAHNMLKDENKQTRAAFSEAIKDTVSEVERPESVNYAAINQMKLCCHPKSPVKFLGLILPNISLSVNEIDYRLTATAMARSGGKLYATGIIKVEGYSGYKFAEFDTNGAWYEITKMPGVTNKITHEEE